MGHRGRAGRRRRVLVRRRRRRCACGAVFTADLTGLEGAHHLAVFARDAAGNVSELGREHLRPRHHRAGGARCCGTPRTAPTGPGGSASRPAPPPSAPSTADRGAPCASPLPGGASGQDRALRGPRRRSRRQPLRHHPHDRDPDDGGGRRPTAPPRRPRRHAARATSPSPDPPTRALGPSPASSPPSAGPPAPARQRAARPAGAGGTEVEATAMLRRFRPEDGPFAGPVRELLQAAAETTTIPVLVILVVIAFVGGAEPDRSARSQAGRRPAPHTSPSTWSSIERRRPPDPAAPASPPHRRDERARPPDGARAVARARARAAGGAHAARVRGPAVDRARVADDARHRHRALPRCRDAVRPGAACAPAATGTCSR